MAPEKEKISDDPRLDDIVIEFSRMELIDATTDKQSQMTKRRFTLTVPYLINTDGKITFPRHGLGSRDILYELPEVTLETAKDLAEGYFRFSHSDTIVNIDFARPKIYRHSSKESLQGIPINAFEAQGDIYKLMTYIPVRDGAR
jgi:hypothetical protein